MPAARAAPEPGRTRRILGIDPGLNRTGYGILEVRGGALRWIDSGVLRIPAGELPVRLQSILAQLGELIRAHCPQEVAVEKVFVNINPQASLLLGQARGAAICAAVQAAIPVSEYTALQVKQATTGYGRADKVQMQRMVQRLLGLDRAPPSDAADALACAICHAHSVSGVRWTHATAAVPAAPSTAPRRSARGSRASRRAWSVLAEGK
jgi:crossover junction endodeoxyribonuclease RuvC